MVVLRVLITLATLSAAFLISCFAIIMYQSEMLGKCSTVCESKFCDVPLLLRYGKYCGLQITGCPGEPPCDDLDACYKAHDDCIGKLGNYLNKTCNHNLLQCVKRHKASGKGHFAGNTCDVKHVELFIINYMKLADFF
ncbi:hypothetical protein KP509_26G059400 [Ceratopteris richardii]|uniref:Phospholipase A(2) n=1 Tax=Ceratopteris richardii TaxID=49495 RepID=A0A8T2RLI3_CERRI|nr:hypothetical protein KP509_26G059400 [Ceratopteris richardii]